MALSVPNANGGVRDKNGEAKIIIELVKPPKRAYGLRRAAASPSTLDPRSAPGCRSPVDPRPLHLSHGMVGFARGGHLSLPVSSLAILFTTGGGLGRAREVEIAFPWIERDARGASRDVLGPHQSKTE